MQLLLLASSDAPGNPVSFELLPAITAFVVFGVAFAVLATKVWPTIAKALDERNAKIKGEIKAAEEARAAAKSAQAEFEKSLANAREEAANMIKQARADAQRVADELQAQSAALATEIAGKILRRQVNDQDNARLVQESLQELASSRR
jgi:F-type H+-transporting ATPase subunit b